MSVIRARCPDCGEGVAVNTGQRGWTYRRHPRGAAPAQACPSSYGREVDAAALLPDTPADDPGPVEKLVRDDIPKIATAAGQHLCLRTAEPHEMRGLLIRKLAEETREVADAMTADETLAELADLTEVRDALLAELGYTAADLGRVRADKLKERGGFTRRIVLVTR